MELLKLPKPHFYGWTMLASLWGVMFLNLGFPAYGPAVINAAMAAALGLPREARGTLFSVYMIMSGLPGPLVAIGINRFGVRSALCVGSALIALGSVLMATVVEGAVGGMLCFGVLVGAGVATGSALASQTALARWFIRRRALAFSVLYSANAVGGLVAAPLLERLIETSGSWRAGWWLIAMLSAAAAVIAVLLVRERPEDVGQSADGLDRAGVTAGTVPDSHPGFVSRREWAFRDAVRQPSYWLLLGSLVGCTAGYTLFLAHGIAHFQDLGHSARVGAWSVGVMSATGLVGKLILATLGDRVDPRYLFASFVAVFAGGMVCIVDALATWQVFFVAACIGVGFGGAWVGLMSVLSNYFGTRAFASLSGLAIAINTTLSAIAPKVAGRLFDQGAGYGAVFYFLAVWCFAGAVVSFCLRAPGTARPQVAAPAARELP